jgi:hypothetical protein
MVRLQMSFKELLGGSEGSCGNFFLSVLEGYFMYLLPQINSFLICNIHVWNEEDLLSILSYCWHEWHSLSCTKVKKDFGAPFQSISGRCRMSC